MYIVQLEYQKPPKMEGLPSNEIVYSYYEYAKKKDAEAKVHQLLMGTGQRLVYLCKRTHSYELPMHKARCS